MRQVQIVADGAIHPGTMLLRNNGTVVYAGPLRVVPALAVEWDELVLSPEEEAQYVEYKKRNPLPPPKRSFPGGWLSILWPKGDES